MRKLLPIRIMAEYVKNGEVYGENLSLNTAQHNALN